MNNSKEPKLIERAIAATKLEIAYFECQIEDINGELVDVTRDEELTDEERDALKAKKRDCLAAIDKLAEDLKRFQKLQDKEAEV